VPLESSASQLRHGFVDAAPQHNAILLDDYCITGPAHRRFACRYPPHESLAAHESAAPCSHGTRWRWRDPSLHIGMHSGARALGGDGRLAPRVQTRCHVPTRNDSTVRSVRAFAVSEQSIRATLSPSLGAPDPLPKSQ
jgi:hypothetical protein